MSDEGDAIVKWILIGLLRAYRLLISPLYGQVCRYHPTCSAYALDAVTRHGAAKGSWLAVRRVGRCHPWAAGGYDPVPEQFVFSVSTKRTDGDQPAVAQDAGQRGRPSS